MIITFYSYKGGVGRTMALANIAELLYQAGQKVLMVDWDLEAPGLERFFSQSLGELQNKVGVINILLEYKDQMAQEVDGKQNSDLFPDVRKFLVDVYPKSDNGGKLWLIPAGRRDGSYFREYANAVQTFDWQDFYQNWEGELFFYWLIDQFSSIADIVLIDSRTGVTEMGGVCVYQLADAVVMFCAPNQQNLSGTEHMAREFSRNEVKEYRRGRELKILIVPSRVEDRAESVLLANFREQFQKQLMSFSIDSDFQRRMWELKIPHVPFYAFNEIVAVNQALSDDLTSAYLRLLNEICSLFPEHEERLSFVLAKIGKDRKQFVDTTRPEKTEIVQEQQQIVRRPISGIKWPKWSTLVRKIPDIVKVGIIGPPGCGKTTYMAMLQFSNPSIWRIKPIGAQAQELVIYVTQALREEFRFPDATPLEAKYLTFDIEKESGFLRRRINHRVVFPEAPGEFYEKPEIYPELIDEISRYHGILWLIDPTQVLNPSPGGRSYRRTIQQWLYELYGRQTGQGNLKHYIAFCLTKMDLPEFSNHIRSPKEFCLNLLGSDVQVFLESYCDLQKIDFFATSSVGFKPGTNISNVNLSDPYKLVGPATPFGLVEPLEWIFSNL